MSDENLPPLRRDLEFFPVQLQGKQYVLIRDPLGLVQEGKAVEIPLYRFMALLDGTVGVTAHLPRVGPWAPRCGRGYRRGRD